MGARPHGERAKRFGRKLSSKSDLELMRLVRGGDEQAFEQIVGRYEKRLTKQSARLVGADFAADVVQHTLLAVHAMMQEPERRLETVNLEAWLYRTSRNRSIDILRSQSYLVATADMTHHSCMRKGSAHSIADRDKLNSLIEEIQELPERQRMVLLLREFEGLSYDEIAERLETSSGAVNQLLRRARKTLRNSIGLLLPLPLVKLAFEGLAVSVRSVKPAELVASAGTPAAAKTAAVVMAAGALVAGGVALDSKQPARQAAAQKLSRQPHEGFAARSIARVRHAARRETALPGGARKPDDGQRPTTTPSVQPPHDQQSPLPPAKKREKQAEEHTNDGGPQPASQVTSPQAQTQVSFSMKGTSPREGWHIDRPEIIIEQAEGAASSDDIEVARRGDAFIVAEASGAPMDISGASQVCSRITSTTHKVSCAGTYEGTPTGLTVRGGDGDDSLTVADTNTMIAGVPAILLLGGPGDDTLIGGPGQDWLAGGPGSDRIEGRGGGDLLDGGSAFVTPDPEDGADVLLGGEGDDWVFGDAGDNELRGGPGNDRLQGGQDRDLLVGGSGEDLVNGGPSHDTYELRDGEQDTRPCPEEEDTLHLDEGLDRIVRTWVARCG